MEEGYDMKYIGMPLGIWLFFRISFQRNLIAVFEPTPTKAQAVMVESKGKYKEIIRNLTRVPLGTVLGLPRHKVPMKKWK